MSAQLLQAGASTYGIAIPHLLVAEVDGQAVGARCEQHIPTVQPNGPRHEVGDNNELAGVLDPNASSLIREPWPNRRERSHNNILHRHGQARLITRMIPSLVPSWEDFATGNPHRSSKLRSCLDVLGQPGNLDLRCEISPGDRLHHRKVAVRPGPSISR